MLTTLPKRFVPRFLLSPASCARLLPVFLSACLPGKIHAQDRDVFFSTEAVGVDKSIPTWGLDTAWLSEENVRRGVLFMGQPQVDVIRFSFTPDRPLVNGDLEATRQTEFDERMRIVDTYTDAHTELYLNVDFDYIDPYFQDANGNTDPQKWAEIIDLTRQKCEDAGHTVVSVAPFNEPDYGTVQGDVTKLGDVCWQIRNTYGANFASIRLCGGSTLNTDQAAAWYNTLNGWGYLEEGNTHELAGSFDNYAAFHQNVQANGDVGCNDELHNVMEAMVGVEYGLDTAIWWGTAEHTRAEFVKTSDGQRLGYAEDRPNWTAASVYRAPDGKVQAFLGASERQATTTTYRFVSKDRNVFYDGQGPLRSLTVTVPGGTGYGVDQPSMEKVINITWGEDIQPQITPGRYVLVNRKSGKVMEVASGNTQNGGNIQLNSYTGASYQLWDVAPLPATNGGDCSYYTFLASHSGKSPDVSGYSFSNGGNIQQWGDGTSVLQQWYLEYAGDGYFYIRSRWNTLCLEVASGSTSDGANIDQWLPASRANQHQQWRLIPAGEAVEFNAPSAPTGLAATPGPASVRLSWNSVTASDLAGYDIVRASASSGPYELIARGVTDTSFTDASANQSLTYFYKIRASDRSLNKSAYSPVVSASPTNAPALIADLSFDSNTEDFSGQGNSGTAAITPNYVSGYNGQSLEFDGSSQFLNLPAEVANHDQLTLACWVYWNGGSDWQRIFDFGNGTGEYLFLTPKAGGAGLRFAIKNNGGEQQLNTSALPTGQWVHVAVVLGSQDARLYVNGSLADSSSAITIKPTDFRPVMNYLGKSQWPDPLFSGRIDEFKIYNYTLTQTQVACLVAGAPAAPSGLGATAEPLAINLSWSPVSQATSYDVAYSTGNDAVYSPLAEGLTSTVWKHDGLTYGTTYHYIVTASNIAGSSPDSVAISASPLSALISDSEIRSVQVGTVIEAGDLVSPSLSVSSSVPGHSYQLQYSDDLNLPWSNLGDPLPGNGGSLILSLPSSPAKTRGFFRVLISR